MKDGLLEELVKSYKHIEPPEYIEALYNQNIRIIVSTGGKSKITDNAYAATVKHYERKKVNPDSQEEKEKAPQVKT